MVTIKDVARRAGVSVGTVSNILNKTKPVRPETEKKVLTAMADLGYSLNLHARYLVSGRSNIVGLIVSDIRNPYFPAIARAFQEESLKHNIETMLMNSNYDSQRTLSLVKRLIELRVRGVALITTEFDPLISKILKKNNIPAVYYGHETPHYLISKISSNYEQGFRETINYLYSIGHRHIAFICGPLKFASFLLRKEIFLRLMKEHPSSFPYLIVADSTFNGGYEACGNLLQDRKITAILAINDLAAIGAIHYAHDNGIKIPDELSVIGAGGADISELIYPQLTTMAASQEEIGRFAFKSLWEMAINRNHMGKEYNVGFHLITRESTKPLAG